MNKILRFFGVFLCVFVVEFSGFSQITVKSFVELDNNLDATTNYPKKDLNGKTCAIIKIFTTQKGFSFDAGQVGIVATEYKPAEIWLYVPGGTRKLKITHSQMGHIATDDPEGFFWFPEGGVKSGNCYRMDIEEPEKQTGWVVFNSTPLGADVYLSQDGEEETHLGITPLSRRLPYGMYSYRLKKNKYSDEVGLLEVKDERLTMAITLKPVIETVSIDTTAISKKEIEPKPENKPVVEVSQPKPETPAIVKKEEPKPKIKSEVPVVEVKKDKESFYKFGLEGCFDYSSMSSFGKTSFGVGAMVRLGRMSSLINVNLGVKYQMSSVSKDLSYDFLDYESYNTFKGSAKYKNSVNEILIPAIINFNLKNVAYVGVGYELGLSIGNKETYTPSETDGFDYDVYQAYSEYNGEDITPVSFPSSSIVLQAGWLHKHYDVKLYYKYDLANTSKSPMTIGVGVGYYF